ncbi:MAG: hypothetical protein R2822_09210 [Spirosomataceae bacterium]
MKTPWLEIVLGWSSMGFFVIWILEIQRVDFVNSYWLLMFSLACLLSFQFLRRKRNAEPMLAKYVPEIKKEKVKKQKGESKKRRSR